MGKYSVVVKKKPTVWQRIKRLLGWLLIIAVTILVGGGFYRSFLKVRVEALVVKFLGVDIVLLFYFLFYIFVVCGVILVALIYWVGWENLKFRFKQRHYRSALVVPHYYKDRKRIRYDRAIGVFEQYSDNKLDVSGKENEELALANLDDSGTGVAAGKIAFKNGKLDGVFVSYYENRRVESEVSYKEGRLDGPFRAYYPDGKFHVEKFYHDGKLAGIFRAWDEDGSIFFEINYKDGFQDGFDKTFYRSGVLQYLDTYEEGRKVNRKTYDEAGNLKYDEDFD
jgi:antitoxin component YwqK of YwqJK toxin-antitoxin module